MNRRFINYFRMVTPTGCQVVVQEWCNIIGITQHGEEFGSSRLVTTIGKSVSFDPAAGLFKLADGTPLTTNDPRADATRRRMSDAKQTP